jgi:dTMP kinase
VSLFVTFEGIEGSGKSTHLGHLAGQLRAGGHAVVETREPGGTRAGAAVRELLLGADGVPLAPLTELFLYCADRAQHVAEVIKPALAAGRVVLCDRFSDSTIAYQGYGRGLDGDALGAMDARARDGLAPDLTLLLDCPVEVGLRRARQRSAAGDRFEREAVEFHERVRAGFLALAKGNPARFHVLDATAPIDDIRRRVITEVDARLGRRS